MARIRDIEIVEYKDFKNLKLENLSQMVYFCWNTIVTMFLLY